MKITRVTLQLKKKRSVDLAVVTDGGLVCDLVVAGAEDEPAESAWEYLGDLLAAGVLEKAGTRNGETAYRLAKVLPRAEKPAKAEAVEPRYTPVLEAMAASEPTTSA